uniref:Farnesyl pyrophosphate synthase n=1 Tax=Saccoglossus kowalevskii TaxID=10224 RepID=A0ABM0MX37_SACKO|nr:PREDICTED: farnesyl pyrophosphate synthase-like [Saccoglossus kowalevskii]
MAHIKMEERNDAKRFGEMFQELVREIVEPDLEDDEIGDAMKRFKHVLEYNVPGGKRNRGLTVLSSYKSLKDKSSLDDEEMKCAMVLGWCIEWLQAYFLVSDDMMDGSITRRGQPCWYKKPGIGLDAINDSFFIEVCIYKMLKKTIRNKPYYISVVELFHEIDKVIQVGGALLAHLLQICTVRQGG